MPTQTRPLEDRFVSALADFCREQDKRYKTEQSPFEEDSTKHALIFTVYDEHGNLFRHAIHFNQTGEMIRDGGTISVNQYNRGNAHILYDEFLNYVKKREGIVLANLLLNYTELWKKGIDPSTVQRIVMSKLREKVGDDKNFPLEPNYQHPDYDKLFKEIETIKELEGKAIVS